MTETNATQPPGDPEPPNPMVLPGGIELPEWLAFLRNRAILGGLGLVVVLLLATIVLVALGGGDDGLEELSAAGVETPVAKSTVASGQGLTGNVIVTATMRIGPATTYAILGTIPSGALVSVIGRNANSSWLQVIYPPGSQLKGWVPAKVIEVTGDTSKLAVAGPGEGPSVPVPTSDVPLAYFTPVPPPIASPDPTSITPAIRTPLPTATTAAPPATATPPPTQQPPAPTAPSPPTNTPPAPPTVTEEAP